MPSRTPSPQNTRRNYAGQYRKFRDWCEREKQSALPASPEVVTAYAAELMDDGKSMSTVRLVVSAIGDTHRRVNLESGVSETLRGLARQLGVSQKQVKPLDTDALAAVRATVSRSLCCAFTLCVGTRSRRSPADKPPAAVFTCSSRPFSGDVPVQTDLADQAAVPVNVAELVLAGDCPDALVHVTAWLAAPL